MVKKAPLSTKRAKPMSNKVTEERRAKIAATLAELDQIEPGSAKAAKAIALFKSWLADESGYDEEVWPRLKKALEQERDRLGARRLFNA